MWKRFSVNDKRRDKITAYFTFAVHTDQDERSWKNHPLKDAVDSFIFQT